MSWCPARESSSGVVIQIAVRTSGSALFVLHAALGSADLTTTGDRGSYDVLLITILFAEHTHWRYDMPDSVLGNEGNRRAPVRESASRRKSSRGVSRRSGSHE